MAASQVPTNLVTTAAAATVNTSANASVATASTATPKEVNSTDFVAMLTKLLGTTLGKLSTTGGATTVATSSASATGKPVTSNVAAANSNATIAAIAAALNAAADTTTASTPATTVAATPPSAKKSAASDAASGTQDLDILNALLASPLMANAIAQGIPPVVAQAISQATTNFVAQASATASAAVGGATSGGATPASNMLAVTAKMVTDGAKEIARDVQTILLSSLSVAADTSSASGAATKDGSDSGNNNQNSAASAATVGAVLNSNSQQSVSPADMQLKEHVGTAAWHDEVGAKLAWMIDRGVQSGSLRLSPERLGPLEVRISVQNDQATVWFGAAHADTRASLEQALPRLRELFAGSGLALADAGVFREPPKQNYQNQSSTPAGERGGQTEFKIAVAKAGAANGLLDAYA